jgi:hypothetical protein
MNTYSDSFIEDNRLSNVEFTDWADDVIDSFKERLSTEYGIEAGRTYFTGFWCQGDGACFEGYVSDWEKFLKAWGDTDYPALRHLALNMRELGDIQLSWQHRGRYYHSNALAFDFEFYVDEKYCVEDEGEEGEATTGQSTDLRTILHTMKLADCWKEADAFEKYACEFVRGLCDDLYKELEKTYDCLTSDEAVIGTLQANDVVEEVEEELAEAA